MKNNYYKIKGCFLLLLVAVSFVAQASNEVQSVRVWPSPDNTRVVFDMSAAPEHKSFSLDKPDRLVIDLSNIKGGSSLPEISGESALIKAIRSSGDANSMRIVLDLAKEINDIDLPGFFLHPLTGDRKGQWSITVTGNWRITFELNDGDVYIVNYEDYH